MKKFVPIALILLIGASVLAGCARQNKPIETSTGDKLSVVATIFPPYDFTRAVAGDSADVTMLLPPASESHSFEPTPQDIIKIQNCDVFIYVGGESDEWVNEVLSSMDTSGMKIVTLMDCVDVVEEEIVEGMEDEEEAEDPAGSGEAEEPEYDEHVWTSPENAKLIVQKISDALCEADAAGATTYKQNTAAYLSKLDALDSAFQTVVDAAARKTLVFGDRFPFRYFADAYGLTYFAAFPGCSTETEASAATVKFLIDKINAEKIPVVFHIELSNEKMANTISEATGAKVLLLHACHNISKADFEAGKTYLDIMTANVTVLKEALQ
ncbi:MAG: metal ABC transporter substrate-binding protein [Oscillospiraceae bacterium]|jgi:zinc transport system substrate-binding protein|nr:metal ABC transporter substrate-binding protein [Oscillospiraceae bacterium]